MPDILDDPILVGNNRDVSGGMNSKVFPTEIPDNQAAELFDVDISIPGKRKKRNGYTLIADDQGSDRVNALADFKPDGGNHELIHRAGTALRKFTGAGGWTDLDNTLANNINADMIQAFNLLFILQGSSGNVHTYDGSTPITDEADTNTDPPKTTHGVWALNRLFLAGDVANPLFLYYSDVLDPQTFDRLANAVKFNEGFGAAINGVIEWNKNILVVCTDRNVHVLDISAVDPSNWIREIINPSTGCAAFRSLQRVGNDVFYLGTDRKVRSLIRTQQDAIRGEDNPVTEPIESFLDDIDISRIDESTAVFFNEAYYLAVPIAGFLMNSHVIKIDTQTRGITIFRNWPVQSWAISDILGSENRLYGGEANADTKVYRFLSGFSDNGTAIEYSETTKRINFGAPQLHKRWQFIEVSVLASGSGSFVVEAQVDGGGFSFAGSGDIAADLPTLPIDLPFDLGGTVIVPIKVRLDAFERGRDIQFRFTQDTLDLEVEVLGFTLTAFVEEMENEND